MLLSTLPADQLVKHIFELVPKVVQRLQQSFINRTFAAAYFFEKQVFSEEVVLENIEIVF